MMMFCLVAADEVIISASVDERLATVWSLPVQSVGTPAYRMRYPVRDRAVLGLLLICSRAKEASMKHSELEEGSRLRVVPLS